MPQVQSMTLGNFIAEMKRGWGFWRAARVQRIGEALAMVFAEHQLSIPVNVEFERGHYGYGPSFHYTYEWKVDGIPAPAEGRLPPSKADVLFGFSAGNLPELQKTNTGFRVGYEW